MRMLQESPGAVNIALDLDTEYLNLKKKSQELPGADIGAHLFHDSQELN